MAMRKLQIRDPDVMRIAIQREIERAWKLARRLATHNRYFATLDELLATVEACFNRWQKPNPVLRRLCGIV